MILPKEDSGPKGKKSKPISLSKFKKSKETIDVSSAHPFRKDRPAQDKPVIYSQNNVLFGKFPDHSKVSANDKGGGGPPKGGKGKTLCQDVCPDLKSWLQSYCEIPNSFFVLGDEEAKERHIKARANSKAQRLNKYGDSRYEPERAKPWHRQMSHFKSVTGWVGHRPPTLETLYSVTKKADKHVGPYLLDEETQDFLTNNQGKKFLINPLQNCKAVSLMTNSEYECPFPVNPTSGVTETSNDDWYIVPLELRAKAAPCSQVKSMCLISETPQAFMKRAIRARNKWVDPLLNNRERYNETALNITPIEEELRYYLSKADLPQQGDVDTERLSQWLSPVECALREHNSSYWCTNTTLSDGVLKKELRFLDMPQSDGMLCEEWCEYTHWWESLTDEDIDCIRYQAYWENTDQARYSKFLSNTIALNEGPRVAPRRQCGTTSSRRWNMYVMMFNKYSRGQCSKEYLDVFAKKLWDQIVPTTNAFQEWIRPFNSEPYLDVPKEDVVVEGEYIPKEENVSYKAPFKPSENNAPFFDDLYFSSVKDGFQTGYPREDVIRTLAKKAHNRVMGEQEEEKIFIEVPLASGKDDLSMLCLKQAHKRLSNGLFMPVQEFSVTINDQSYHFKDAVA